MVFHAYASGPAENPPPNHPPDDDGCLHEYPPPWGTALVPVKHANHSYRAACAMKLPGGRATDAGP
jgi:hypothetical protein